MAVEQFSIEKYQIKMGQALQANWNGVNIRARGVVSCYGDDHKFVAYFLTKDSPVPEPMYDPKKKVGCVFLPFFQMNAFVDILREEEPVFAYLNSERAEWNNISTSKEPIGEEEA